MDLQSTITLVGFAGFAVSMFGYLAAMKRDLRSEMVGMEVRISERFDAKLDTSATTTDVRLHSMESRMDARFESMESRFDAVDARIGALDARVSDLRQDVRAGFAATNARLTTLEQRTFDIGRRRQPDAG